MRISFIAVAGFVPALLLAQPAQEPASPSRDFSDEVVLMSHMQTIQTEFTTVSKRLQDLELQRIQLQRRIHDLEEKLNLPSQAALKNYQ